MRILHVTHYHERLGGAEVHVHSLTDELRRRGHAVGFFAGSPETEIDTPEVRVVKRPYFAHAAMLRDLPLRSEYLRYARTFRPDVIHVHKLFAFPVEFVLALRTLRVPLVHTVYDYTLFCPNGWCVWPDGTVCAGGPGKKCFQHGCEKNHRYDARAVLTSFLRFRALRRSIDEFICPTDHLAETCRAHGFRRVHTLPYFAPREGRGHAVDASAASAAPPHESGRILCVSRLEKEKGVAVLLEAFALLAQRIPSARLSVVGSGPEEERLRARAAELGLAQAIEFHGAVPLEELAHHFERAAVLVLPSIWCEALPLVAFDALAAGLPMVASDIGGIPTIVRDGITGLLARPRDPADFAARIERILSDGELRARLSAGCRADQARYSRERHLDRIEEIYRGAGTARTGGRSEERGVLGRDEREILHHVIGHLDEVESAFDAEHTWLVKTNEALKAEKAWYAGESADLAQSFEVAKAWFARDRQGMEEKVAWFQRDGDAAKQAAREAVAHNGQLAEKIAAQDLQIHELRQLLRRVLSGRVTSALARLRKIPGIAEFLD